MKIKITENGVKLMGVIMVITFLLMLLTIDNLILVF